MKRYAAEVGTAWVIGVTDPRAGNYLHTVRLTGPEMVAALFRKVRTGAATQIDIERAAANFASDWQGQYEIVDVIAAIADRAMQLARRYPLRGYDAVHLAAALETNDTYQRRSGSHVTLISADQDQLQAAASEGMLIDDPNGHP
ncbi:MAG: type II toxin-antitoxin system VapC family toxin [Dehalococcoidia bacterium]